MNLDAAKRQEVYGDMYDSWSDEERMMDEILQAKNDKTLNMTQKKSWKQQDEDERLMDEILGIDAMKTPKKGKKLKVFLSLKSSFSYF